MLAFHVIRSFRSCTSFLKVAEAMARVLTDPPVRLHDLRFVRALLRPQLCMLVPPRCERLAAQKAVICHRILRVLMIGLLCK